MTILSLDPSSTCIGYALARDGVLIEHGRITPTRQRAAANERIQSMLTTVEVIVAAERVKLILIEDTSGKVGKRHGGNGAGLAVYGKAVGAIWQRLATNDDAVEMIPENRWTRGIPKQKRQLLVARTFRDYDAKRDPGGDAADAIGLWRWWEVEGRIRERTVTDGRKKRMAAVAERCKNKERPR